MAPSRRLNSVHRSSPLTGDASKREQLRLIHTLEEFVRLARTGQVSIDPLALNAFLAGHKYFLEEDVARPLVSFSGTPADLLLSSSPSSCGTNSPPSSPSTSARLPPVPPTWRVELHYSYEGESWVCQDSTCVNIRASSARPFGAYKSTNGGTSSIRKRAWEHWYSKHLQDELDVVGPIVLSRETSPSTTAPDSPTENTFTPDLQTLDLPVTPFTTSQELDEPFVFDDPTAMDFDQLQLPDFTLYPYDPPPGGTTYFADFSQGLFFRK